ncbi:MAG TPA: DUF6152 family protein [Bryobacteraceae bacterium]|nr:DUF6152 family protein [Bryobacteraceae bacterium]
MTRHILSGLLFAASRSLLSAVCLLLSTLCLLAIPAAAHHSFAAEYDASKPVTYTGVVTRIDWENPHVYIYMDVKGADGQVTNMAVEGHPPNTLRRTGWHQSSVQVGDTISVTGWASKDSSARMAGREVTLADGKKLYIGPPAH